MDIIDDFLGKTLKEDSLQIEPLLKPYEKNILIIVCGARTGARESFASIQKLAKTGHYMTLIPTENGEKMWNGQLKDLTGADRLLNQYSGINPENLIKSNSALIIAGLSTSAVSKIASACFDSYPLYIIYQFMLAGKKIVASNYGVLKSVSGENSNFSNKALETIINSNLSKTADMGIKYVAPYSIHEEFELSGFVVEREQNALNTYNKNVLSSSDLTQYPENLSLYIRKGTVVTPSAKDTAKLKKIKIINKQ